MKQKAFLALAIIGIILVSGCVQKANSPNVGCTQEAKICPDGSAVGRIPPNCEFEPCPQSQNSEQGATIVRGAGGQAMLDGRCANETYANEVSDYVVKGTVTKVESKLTNGNIFTYTDIDIDEYAKGARFENDNLQIVTPGGCADGFCSDAEDQPAFTKGDYVQVRFQKSGDEYVVVCGFLGVRKIS